MKRSSWRWTSDASLPLGESLSSSSPRTWASRTARRPDAPAARWRNSTEDIERSSTTGRDASPGHDASSVDAGTVVVLRQPVCGAVRPGTVRTAAPVEERRATLFTDGQVGLVGLPVVDHTNHRLERDATSGQRLLDGRRLAADHPPGHYLPVWPVRSKYSPGLRPPVPLTPVREVFVPAR